MQAGNIPKEAPAAGRARFHRGKAHPGRHLPRDPTGRLPSLPPTRLRLRAAGKERNEATPHAPPEGLPVPPPGPAPPPSTHVLVVLHHPHRQRRVGPQAAPAGPVPAASRRAAHAAGRAGQSAALPPSLPPGGRRFRPQRPPTAFLFRSRRAACRAGLGGGAPGGLGGPGCLLGGRGAGRISPWAAPSCWRSRGGSGARAGGGGRSPARWGWRGARRRRRCWRAPGCRGGSGRRGPGGPCRQRLPRQPAGLRLRRPLRVGSGAVRREGSAAGPARPGVALAAGFVSADPSVAVGSRWLDVAWPRCPVALRWVSAGREECILRN